MSLLRQMSKVKIKGSVLTSLRVVLGITRIRLR